MSQPKKANLVFIPFPVISHVIAAVNFANLLADRHHRLAVTVLVIQPRTDTKITSFTQNSPNSRINFIHLPKIDSSNLPSDPKIFIPKYIENQKSAVRAAVTRIASDPDPDSGLLAGFVLDILCCSMIDVATEFSVPSYLLYTSGQASLNLFFHLQSLRDINCQDLTAYNHPRVAISVPGFVNPVPSEVIPQHLLDKEGNGFLNDISKFRNTKGIILNTFLEFETFAINYSMSNLVNNNLPPMFPVGPIIQSENEGEGNDEIVRWLDSRPDSSVVFLCFGSRGAFDEEQVKAIADALEKCGHGFLWSLRKRPPKGTLQFPREYEKFEDVLPEGFLERVLGVGKVIGWAPQMVVLSHRAIGGFVTHCGWNSILESVWRGVPMTVWPMEAEQQVNAFQLVKELGIAEEVKMDYRRDGGEVVGVDCIEKAIRRLMDPGNGIRVRVKEMMETSRRVTVEGGSSYDYLTRFVQTVFDNIS